MNFLSFTNDWLCLRRSLKIKKKLYMVMEVKARFSEALRRERHCQGVRDAEEKSGSVSGA